MVHMQRSPVNSTRGCGAVPKRVQIQKELGRFACFAVVFSAKEARKQVRVCGKKALGILKVKSTYSCCMANYPLNVSRQAPSKKGKCETP